MGFSPYQLVQDFSINRRSPQWPKTLALIISPNGSRLCNWQPILFAISCAWFTLILGACNVRHATYHDQIFEEVKHRVFWGGSQNGRSTVKDSFSGAKTTQRATTYLTKRQLEKKQAALNHRLDTLSEGLSVDFGFLRYGKTKNHTTHHVFVADFYIYQLPRHPFLKHSNHLAELRNTQGTSL